MAFHFPYLQNYKEKQLSALRRRIELCYEVKIVDPNVHRRGLLNLMGIPIDISSDPMLLPLVNLGFLS